MTPDQIRWLTWGAIQHRPSGAPKWDEPGTHKAIADNCGTWGLEIATDHVLAHARDPKARTPFAIKGNKPHSDATKTPAGPPKPSDCCRTCGRALHAPDVVCDQPTQRPTPAAPPTDTYLAARSGLHAREEFDPTPTTMLQREFDR